MIAPGNISRIGSFRAHEREDGSLVLEQQGYALEPHAPYELRTGDDGYGCEDPRVTFVAMLDAYVMAYVAFGPRGPEVALAISDDGLRWHRVGLMRFGPSAAPLADKDAAFFPEPVRSPCDVPSLAFYHRPMKWPQEPPVSDGSVRGRASLELQAPRVPRAPHERISIGYVPLDLVSADISNLCRAAETHQLILPSAPWGRVKVGAGTPPVRIHEGWLAIIHGIDLIERPGERSFLRYSAGTIVHDAERLDRVLYRSPAPLFAPETHAEIEGTVRNVVFPTAIDPRPDVAQGAYDIYYGMADDAMGRGRLTLT
jgi:predicted GH43/DUF377 family glycosyl hydrolase